MKLPMFLRRKTAPDSAGDYHKPGDSFRVDCVWLQSCSESSCSNLCMLARIKRAAFMKWVARKAEG